jgi:hypothetical protein
MRRPGPDDIGLWRRAMASCRRYRRGASAPGQARHLAGAASRAASCPAAAARSLCRDRSGQCRKAETWPPSHRGASRPARPDPGRGPRGALALYRRLAWRRPPLRAGHHGTRPLQRRGSEGGGPTLAQRGRNSPAPPGNRSSPAAAWRQRRPLRPSAPIEAIRGCGVARRRKTCSRAPPATPRKSPQLFVRLCRRRLEKGRQASTWHAGSCNAIQLARESHLKIHTYFQGGS